MIKYKAIPSNQVIVENYSLLPKDFSSIYVTNTGTNDLYINDNILLEPGDSWSLETRAYIVIGETTKFRFDEVNPGGNIALIELISYIPV